MGKKPSAHDLVKPALEGLVKRTRAAARRVVADESDPEAVHDFRVGLRRLRTVLRASRSVYRKADMKLAIAAVKRFGDATNALRDEEVLGETIAMTKLDDDERRAVAGWLADRARRERVLRHEAMALIAGPELQEALSTLLTHVEAGPRADEDAAVFAKRRLAEARKDVRELLPADRSDVAGLHRLRIRFKRLRYTAEMLGRFVTDLDAAAALQKDEPLRKKRVNYGAVAKLAAHMQKDLGQLHDADVALDAISLADDLPAPLRSDLSRALRELRGRLVDRAVENLEQLPSELLGKPIPPATDSATSVALPTDSDERGVIEDEITLH